MFCEWLELRLCIKFRSITTSIFAGFYVCLFLLLANHLKRNDKICTLLQKRQENDIRELNKSLNAYRKTFQAKEDTREFDLNDPDFLKKDKPARISDDDPRCGISSLQKFMGEDLNGKERKKVQQEQVR